MRCGMVVLQFQLADVPAGAGGFCCIPGSHKANYPCPKELLRMEADREALTQPVCKAGDLLIFKEATTHGTLPWKAPHEPRSLLYPFSPPHPHFASGESPASFP